MALVGNTVKLTSDFKSLEGVSVDPQNVTLKIFNTRKEQISENISLGNESKISEGVYVYYYTIPFGSGELYYEFSGEINGMPVIGRGNIERSWV